MLKKLLSVVFSVAFVSVAISAESVVVEDTIEQQQLLKNVEEAIVGLNDRLKEEGVSEEKRAGKVVEALKNAEINEDGMLVLNAAHGDGRILYAVVGTALGLAIGGGLVYYFWVKKSDKKSGKPVVANKKKDDVEK